MIDSVVLILLQTCLRATFQGQSLEKKKNEKKKVKTSDHICLEKRSGNGEKHVENKCSQDSFVVILPGTSFIEPYNRNAWVCLHT